MHVRTRRIQRFSGDMAAPARIDSVEVSRTVCAVCWAHLGVDKAQIQSARYGNNKHVLACPRRGYFHNLICIYADDHFRNSLDDLPGRFLYNSHMLIVQEEEIVMQNLIIHTLKLFWWWYK